MAKALPTEVGRHQMRQAGTDPLKPQEKVLPAAVLGHPRKRVPLEPLEGAPSPPAAGQAEGERSGRPVRPAGGAAPRIFSLLP